MTDEKDKAFKHNVPKTLIAFKYWLRYMKHTDQTMRPHK